MKPHGIPARLVSISAFFLCAPTTPHAQDVCEAFAKYGIYDTQATTSDTDKASSFRLWFCQNNFSSKQSADAAGADLGYGSFTLSLNSNKEEWSQFSSNYCRDETYNEKYRQSTRSLIQTINANASNNMLACFMRGGLHIRVVPGARRDTFYVQTRLTPVGSVHSADVVRFSLVGATCNGPITEGFAITAAGAEQICRRTGRDAVDISLTASELVNWDSPRGLREIPIPPPPPPPPQLISIRAQDFVGGVNVAIDQCVVGPGTLANAPPCHAAPNAAQFNVNARTSGAYRLDINFAAAASRPVKILLNGQVMWDQALSETTGGWENTYLRWTEVGRVHLKEGLNIIRLERANVFPHIHDLRFVPLKE